jgi:3-phosphoshikimate 1-carboxyvinyltransferase
MHSLLLNPSLQVAGEVKLPGSKSLSNRALLLAALAEGVTTLSGVLVSDDTQVMLESLRKLGVVCEDLGAQETWRIHGVGAHLAEHNAFPNKHADFFIGNSGTTARMLTAAVAAIGGEFTLDGVPRMRERPIADLVDGLKQMGCEVSYLLNAGFPPLRIGQPQIDVSQPIRVKGDVSSQFLTGLLQALPLTGQAATVEIIGELISKPYIEMTIGLMGKFGVQVSRDGWQRFHLTAGQRYVSPGAYAVEGDASSASYFLAAGALAGSVTVRGVGKTSVQGDIGFAQALAQMGAKIELGEDWVRASRGELNGIDANMNAIPDAAMTLAVLALFAKGPTTLRDIGSWRVKETDRIHAMVTELRKLGATVEEGDDWIRVTPLAEIKPNVAIDTYDDHRMAMCFSLVSLGAQATPVIINDPNCVAKTFPDYFNRLDSVRC